MKGVRIFFGLVTLLIVMGVSSRPKEIPFQQHFFAIGIVANPSGNEPILSFAIISFFNGEMSSSQQITRETFIRMACGDWPSKANPNKEDLFLANGIETCGRYVDTLYNKKVYLCDPLDSLWKIRFNEHPFVFDSSGWSLGKYKPSDRQMKFLYEEYGVSNINLDYFIGDYMWKLLRDVQDSAWVMNYKSLEDI
ncbi:MAG: hypothetical protein R2799_12790 [Crocinitomicaceae bacterium]